MKEVSNRHKVIMKTKGYSIWLMPTGEVYDKSSNLIKRLAKEYKAPIFEPHVTLLGEVMQSEDEVLKRVEQLASRQKPFSITLRTVDYQDFYFRTLFVKAIKTESLQSLHDRAKKTFEMKDIPEYMPHLSLLYGNFPEAVKERIIKVIGIDQPAEFTVNSVHVFRTDGEVDSWYKVGEFRFFQFFTI